MIALVCAFHTVEAGPNDQAAAHYKQGKTFLDTKQYDQAIVEFQAAYAIDKLSSHLFNIAAAYDAKQDYDHAIEYYQKYLDAEPKSQRAADVRARIAVATQARADAKTKVDAEAARVAAETKRVAGLVHVKQATAYEQAGAWDKAGEEHQLAFTVDGDPSHLLAGAAAFRKHGDLAKSRDTYLAYLDKVPLGEGSDGIRAKVADLTREIEKADEIARSKAQPKPPDLTPKPPPKPRTARVAALAGNATTAATRGDCRVARTIADQVREDDPAYYEAVVVPSIAMCAQPTSTETTPKRFGGGVEIRVTTLKTADFVEDGRVATKATLGSSPSPNTFGLGAFIDISAASKFRVRAGLRLHGGTAKFDGSSCPVGVSICLAALHTQFAGPMFSVERALHRDQTVEAHLLFGGTFTIPLTDGRLDVDNGNGGNMQSGAVKLNNQFELEMGLGLRFGRLFVNLVAGVNFPALTDQLDLGNAKSVSISVGFTSLR